MSIFGSRFSDHHRPVTNDPRGITTTRRFRFLVPKETRFDACLINPWLNQVPEAQSAAGRAFFNPTGIAFIAAGSLSDAMAANYEEKVFFSRRRLCPNVALRRATQPRRLGRAPRLGRRRR